MPEDFLDQRIRAEDILLGSLGFGEEARILSVERTPTGYKGKGRWTDGTEFDFDTDDELDELQEWALKVFGAASP